MNLYTPPPVRTIVIGQKVIGPNLHHINFNAQHGTSACPEYFIAKLSNFFLQWSSIAWSHTNSKSRTLVNNPYVLVAYAMRIILMFFFSSPLPLYS